MRVGFEKKGADEGVATFEAVTMDGVVVATVDRAANILRVTMSDSLVQPSRIPFTEREVRNAFQLHGKKACDEHARHVQTDGPLGHGWECSVCRRFLQAG